ncbi:cupin domain-containing protein [Pikeienuella piscinae]|uniref:Cupin domain-containing protein n=1 Tax=Pikeienuella piscinae TaxID=2748098 RepID=A0A7L5BXC8_9RHOB|nr:cupin domain-containing protein [Pikeienuella piscinae]QIE55498.1 cupin domain-containing protein [Pikeienuella piscinae]
MSSAREPATPEQMIDNDRVRVTRWSFNPGAATGWHVHEYDYIVTPIIGSAVTIVDGEGRETAVEMVAGVSYFREAGVAHDVINAGPGPLVFVETELKEART